MFRKISSVILKENTVDIYVGSNMIINTILIMAFYILVFGLALANNESKVAVPGQKLSFLTTFSH